MIFFGGPIAIKALMFTGVSVPMIFLLNAYTQLAFEEEARVVTGGNEENATAVDTPAVLPTTLPNVTMASYTEKAVAGISRSECRKFIMVMAKRFMKVINKCSKEHKEKFPDKDAYHQRFQCVMRCVLRKAKLIDENLALSREIFDEFMNTQIPEKYHALGRHIATGCIDEWAPKLDPEDEFCTSYGDYIKCLQNEIAEC